LVCHECGAQVAAFKRELAVQVAENKPIVFSHVIAACGNHCIHAET
jgi:hypothetical protein